MTDVIDTTARLILVLEDVQTYRRGDGPEVTLVTRAAWLPELNILALEYSASVRGEDDIVFHSADAGVKTHGLAVRSAVKAADEWGEEIRKKWAPGE